MTYLTQYDWIDGGAVNEPADFWTRVANTYLPWKTNGKLSENKQFLIDVGFNGVPSLTSNGRGGEYTAAQRSELTNLMGKSGYFNEQITRIRNSKPAKEFRELYHSAQEQQLNPDVKTLNNLHKELDMALNNAKKQAEALLTDAERVRVTGNLTRVQDNQLRQGNLETAKETNELLRKYGNN